MGITQISLAISFPGLDSQTIAKSYPAHPYEPEQTLIAFLLESHFLLNLAHFSKEIYCNHYLL